MLYSILRPTTRIVLRGYYKKLFVNGQHHIPKNQPVILAVNHPSAFTEPCVLATHLERELHFLIRGDVINPKVKWFFDQTNQLPIYRFRDGFSSMRQNEKQFSYCFDLLAESGCIVIFAEGSTKHIKQTRPIQKGAARIAFGALQNRDIEDVLIVPVGVNFQSSPRPRSIVAVEIGQPISTRQFYPLYEAEERKGLNAITQEIFNELKPQMVHIEDNARLAPADDLLLFAAHDLNYKTLPLAEYGHDVYFNRMDGVARSINQMNATDWENKQEQLEEYVKLLDSHQLSDAGMNPVEHGGLSWLLLTPLAIIGWIFLGPIYWIAFSIQKRLNQKAEYISGFRMAGFLLLVPVFIILWMVLFGAVWGWWVLIFPLVLPLLSLIGVWWLDGFQTWKQSMKWSRLPSKHREQILDLRERLMAPFYDDSPNS